MNKHEKIKALNIDNITIDELSDEFVDTLYDKYVLQNNDKAVSKTKKVEKKPVKIIDKTTPKYKVLLKLVNKLLLAMGKSEIDDLLNFKMIDREKIIGCDRKIILNMENILCKSFKKGQCFYRKKAPSYNLNILRYLVKEIGLKMIKKQKNIYNGIGNKTYKRTTSYVYYIKKI